MVGCAAITSVRFVFDAVAPAASVSETVTLNVPDAVGLSPMIPVAASIVSPAGNPDAVHANGAVPPVVAIVVE